MRKLGLTGIIIAAAFLYSCDDGTSSQAESDWEYSYRASSVYAPTGDFWFNSPGDGWAVCGDKVLHYNGWEWREVLDFCPDPARWDIYCKAIAAPGPADVWVAGSLELEYPFPDATLLHYDGANWRIVEVPRRTGFSAVYRDLSFTSPDAGWLAAAQGILFYDGASWTRQYDDGAWSLAMSGPADGWALADVGLGEDVLRWDGSTWTPQNIDEYVSGDPVEKLEEIVLTAPDDVWVVGYRGPYYRGVLLHYDGANWAEVPLPDGTPPLEAAAFYGPNSGWILSDAENVGVKAWRLKDGRITASPLPDNNWYVNACATPAPGEAWIMSFPNGNLDLREGRILRYTGGE
ncbi:MAG: hypothetical protein PVH29_10930 [Candidatus Zixiibacteriota bacterium]|jgi:hypothetical protein